jgi:hypothetical protein
MFRLLHKMAAKAKKRKILSGIQAIGGISTKLHRSNYWWNFSQTLQECSVSPLLMHVIGTYRFAARNRR